MKMVTLSSLTNNAAAGAKTSYSSAITNNAVVVDTNNNSNILTTTSGPGPGPGSVTSSTSDRIRLTTQPYPFAGAVLSPKHAQELTPSLCLAIASALAQQQHQNQQQQQQLIQSQNQNLNNNNSISLPHLQGITTTAGSTAAAGGNNSTSSRRGAAFSSASSVSSSSIGGGSIGVNNNNTSTNPNSNNVPIGPAMVPYTLWITEAWRVLGWAEPSAALFWEMATMYHTLLVANRAYTTEYYNTNNSTNNNTITTSTSTVLNNTHYIPPILSCGSASSVGSGTNNSNFNASSTSTFLSPLPNTNNNNTYNNNMILTQAKSKYSTVASAKELPVWLVGIYLLFHCEQYAHERNLAGQIDDRRFMTTSSTTTSSTSTSSESSLSSTTNYRSSPTSPSGSSNMDFNSLLKNTSLSPRMRVHAGWNNDPSHYTAYVLRHLRKILLLIGLSNNPDSIHACIHLAAIPTTQTTSSTSSSGTGKGPVLPGGTTTTTTTGSIRSGNINSPSNSGHSGGGFSSTTYTATDIRRHHDDEHGSIGINVRLTVDDLEHLDFILQPPSGGGIDDPPIRIGEYLWNCLVSSSSSSHHSSSGSISIPLGDIERIVRQHLETDLSAVGLDNEDKDDLLSSDDEDDDGDDNQRRLGGGVSSSSLTAKQGKHGMSNERERAKQPKNNRYHKELSYTNLRGTTILLKPNPPESVSSGASATGSVDQQYVPTSTTLTNGRLHDLVISDCSDAHFYLLQPFEHATISACSNCTIVVGAVAGLLHVVDCEKTNITSAARRILTSNSCDVQLCVFSPSPPLFVGDNRSCQLAPYNTFYDGLHDDLVATGLAMVSPIPALPPPETLSPFHSGMRPGIDYDIMWPQLQKASNKWKQPVELSKLEVPQVPGSPIIATSGSGGNSPTAVSLSPGADDKAMSKTGTANDSAINAPILLPPSEFNILFVPLESESSRQRRLDGEDGATAVGTTVPTLEDGMEDGSISVGGGGPGSGNPTTSSGPGESNYCRLLAEILHLSPFRLPAEYERRVLIKAERMNNIQAVVRQKLTVEQQARFEEELNRGFRDWLVTSGNLRQVLDLVHLERRGGI